MWGYLGRRILSTVPVVLIVAVLVFLMLRLTPGDPAAVIAGDAATSADIAEIRAKLGLSGSIFSQFFIWIGHAFQGDFGESFFYKKSVASLIADRLEPTLALSVLTIILATLVAVPLGTHRGLQAGLVARPRRDGLFGGRLLGAGVRHRLHPDLHLLAQARLVSGAGLPAPGRRLLGPPASPDIACA